MARAYDDRMLTDKELTLAREHPRGTEQRTLAPYRAALNDVDAYAALPEKDRDAIVRWAAIRCAVRDRFGVDRDAANLAEPLIPAAALRAKGCIVDFRPGLVRLSPHHFNTEDEMDATLELLAPLREKVPA